MADVNVVVIRHAADVHADFVGPKRLELFFFAAQGIMDFEHGFDSRRRTVSGEMSFRSGASSGPCARPVKATRSGMNRSGPLRPVCSFKRCVSNFKSPFDRS